MTGRQRSFSSRFGPAPTGPVQSRKPGLKEFDAGFTLIEVLAAILVIGLGCLVVVQMQLMAMSCGAQADRLTVASLLAETQMEIFRSAEMTSLSAGKTYLCCSRLGDCQSRSQNDACGNAAFPYTLDTEIFDDEPTTRSKTLKVEVKWKDANGWRSMDYKASVTDYSF